MQQKKELESRLVVGAKVRLGDKYCDGRCFNPGETVTLVEGEFDYDNGLYTEFQVAPSVWNKESREYDSIYHLFGNDLEDFADCEVLPKTGSELIAEERKRQIEKEGWAPEHDDQHSEGELGRAAENYARFACEPDVARDYQRKNGHIPGGWPWHYSWWKPSVDNSPASRIRDLVKAGALIAAEIDRLQRKSQTER